MPRFRESMRLVHSFLPKEDVERQSPTVVRRSRTPDGTPGFRPPERPARS